MQSVNIFYVFLITLVLAQAKPRHIIYGNCYDVKTSTSFNFTKFSEGKWFEISRYDTDFEEKTTCAEQSFISTVTGKEFKIGFSLMYENGTQGLLQGNVNYTLTVNETLFDATLPGLSSPVAFDVLATDYTSYAITYSCSQKTSDPLPMKDEQLWVLSRDPFLSNEAAEAVEGALIFQGDSLGAYLDDVDQNNCS